MIENQELYVPPLPTLGEGLCGPRSGPLYSGPPRDARTLLHARRVVVEATEVRGVSRVVADGVEFMTACAGAETATSSRVSRGPRGMRRAVAGACGEWLETVVVPRSLPGVVLQWDRANDASVPTHTPEETPLFVFEVPSATAARHVGGVLRIDLLTSSRRAATALFSASTGVWSTQQVERGLRVSLAPPTDQSVTMIAALGPSLDQAHRYLKSCGHRRVHEIQAETDFASTDSRLATSSNDPELDDSIGWAVARLDQPDEVLLSGGLVVVDALLGAGKHERAAAIVQEFVRRDDVTLGARVARSFAFWTGAAPAPMDDPRHLEALAAPLLAAGGGANAESRHEGTYAKPAALFDALAGLADAAGERDLAEALRSHVSQDQTGGLAATIESKAKSAHLAELRSSAEVINAFVARLFGCEPDAPVGRVRIGPEIPEKITDLAITGVRVGDSTLAMEYERRGHHRRFLLRPTSVALPPMIVFEPKSTLPIVGVEIDRVEANLDVEVENDGGWRIRAQLPLDQEREIVVRTR